MCFINLFEKQNANDRINPAIFIFFKQQTEKIVYTVIIFLLLLKCQN
jgi:hypothetical protein